MGVRVARIFIDTGSSVNVMYYDCLKELHMETQLQPPMGPLFGFIGKIVVPVGIVRLPATLEKPEAHATKMVEFMVIDLPNTAYNVILGRPALDEFQAVVSTYHLKTKIPLKGGVGELLGDQRSSKECYVKAIIIGNKRKPPGSRKDECCRDRQGDGKSRKMEEAGEQGRWGQYEEVASLEKPIRPRIEPAWEMLSIELFPGKKEFVTKIGGGLEPRLQEGIIACVRRNADVFSFKPSDLKGLDPKVALHILHEEPMIKLVKQKLRRFGAEKDEIKGHD